MNFPHGLFGTNASSSAEAAKLDSVVPSRDRAEPPPLPISAWTNVVPFARPPGEGRAADATPTLVVSADDRLAPSGSEGQRRAGMVALFGLSLAVHAGLFFLTNREPEPMASIGLEAISVEIVLGANSPAGAASAPSENETQGAPTDTPPEAPKPEVAEQPPPEQPAEVKPEPAQTPPAETAASPPETPPPEPAPVAEAPPEMTPPPKTEVQPEPLQPEVKPEPPKPAVQQPPPKPETRPQPAPHRAAKPNPAPKRETTREAPRAKSANRTERPGPRASAASGIGAGRSSNDTNYRGLVSAHLARYKRFPPEAQNRGAQGSATVSFTLDGGGRVTRASLVRGTGVPALDQEAVAMVHRASPFPAPPDHRAVSFTVPVSYRMR
jgi:periplasmic protein TonB